MWTSLQVGEAFHLQKNDNLWVWPGNNSKFIIAFKVETVTHEKKKNHKYKWQTTLKLQINWKVMPKRTPEWTIEKAWDRVGVNKTTDMSKIHLTVKDIYSRQNESKNLESGANERNSTSGLGLNTICASFMMGSKLSKAFGASVTVNAWNQQQISLMLV